MTDTPTLKAPDLSSFGGELNVAVLGASGGIGWALADQLDSCPEVSRVFRLSRSAIVDRGGTCLRFDLEDEASIENAAAILRQTVGALSLVIVATGLLHRDQVLRPEKTWRSLDAVSMDAAFRINAIGPALVAKHFLPLLDTERKSAFAAISARVGSIEDNRLGGWYAYRASKAALNMLLKTLSIELERKKPLALCIGLHPGTVDTYLSKPFQSGVPAERLFSSSKSAHQMLSVIEQLTPADTGGLFAWDGSRVPF